MTKYLFIVIAILVVTNGISLRYALYLNDKLVTEKNNNAVLNDALVKSKDNVRKANEISKQYQKRLSRVNNDLNTIRMRNENSLCIPLHDTKRRFDDSTAGKIDGDNNGRGGLSSEWLYTFAGQCEQYRLNVIGLQEHFKEIE